MITNNIKINNFILKIDNNTINQNIGDLSGNNNWWFFEMGEPNPQKNF